MQRTTASSLSLLAMLLATSPACTLLLDEPEDLRPSPEDPGGGEIPAASDPIPVMDAANPEEPMPLILSQTSSATVEAGVFLTCAGTEGFHAAHSFFRVFPLDPAVVGQALRVRRVDFGVEQAQAPAGVQPIVVRLHRVTGELKDENLALLAETTLQLGNQRTALALAPFDMVVAAGTQLAVELQIPDGKAAGNVFHLGANRSGQSAPGFIRAPTCGLTAPTSIATTSYPGTHILIQVVGQPLN